MCFFLQKKAVDRPSLAESSLDGKTVQNSPSKVYEHRMDDSTEFELGAEADTTVEDIDCVENTSNVFNISFENDQIMDEPVKRTERVGTSKVNKSKVFIDWNCLEKNYFFCVIVHNSHFNHPLHIFG